MKINGRPSYAYAREGKDVRAAPRPVRIDGIDLVKLDGDRLSVRIRCGRGTYARVLADEIATELGTAGHLVELRRTRSGPFMIDGALTLEQLSVFAADRDDWRMVLRRRRDGERVQWKPRDQVRDGVSPWIVRPVDALSHLPTAAREGDAVLAPAPAGTQPGQRYLVVDGDDVISVAALEQEGPQLVRNLRGRR